MIERCSDCLGVSEAGGAKIDGILTRNSFRVRTESVKYEGDTLPPHVYNKMTRKLEPNPEFIKQFGAHSDQFIEEGEAVKAGMPKLAEHYKEVKKSKRQLKEQQAKQIQHEGSIEDGMKRILEP